MRHADMKLTHPCPAQQGQGPLTPSFSPHPPHEATLGTRIEVGESISKVLGSARGAGRGDGRRAPGGCVPGQHLTIPSDSHVKQNPKVTCSGFQGDDHRT